MSEFHINPDAAAARKLEQKQRLIRVASGREPAQLVLKNATYLKDVYKRQLYGIACVHQNAIGANCQRTAGF